MTEKRDESRLPRVFFGPRTILAFRKGLAPIPIELFRRTENYVEYVPFSDLESVTRERDARIAELGRLYEAEQRHSSALMARVNELTKGPSDA